jgi:hypothetical protein
VPRPVSSEASAMGCDGCASRPMTERVGRFKPDRRSGSGKRYPQGLRGPVSHQKRTRRLRSKSGLQVRASPVQGEKFDPFGSAPIATVRQPRRSRPSGHRQRCSAPWRWKIGVRRWH